MLQQLKEQTAAAAATAGDAGQDSSSVEELLQAFQYACLAQCCHP
jgi:hypothetical protein